jgi:hypothetical protein
MKESTRQQQGSPSRDLFKRKHKDLGRDLYALDIDFALIEKYPYPTIVAILDYKQSQDEITFSEVIAYNSLLERGIPIYIISGDADQGAFTILKYEGGNYKKPISRLRVVHQTENWQEFEKWERGLRLHMKERFSENNS